MFRGAWGVMVRITYAPLCVIIPGFRVWLDAIAPLEETEE